MKPRPEDWPARLDLFFKEAQTRSFAWGQHDCALWAADWLLVLGYPDALGDLRGRWSSHLGAARLLKRLGGLGTATGCRLAAIGVQTVSVAFARRGDLVLIRPSRGLDGLSICTGSRAACLAPQGITFLDKAKASVAWRI